jgi:phosphoglucomutase/phosphomannomutase
VQIVNNLLVGFKYHADVLWQLESTGRYEDVTGTAEDMVIAVEESHGIMAMPAVRDKDSAAAALLFAEAALYEKRQGRTLVDMLDGLSRKFGYYRNEVLNIVMTGIEGKQNMAKMLDAFRSNPPKQIAGMKVTSVEDLRDENGRMGPYKGDTDKAARNFLIFRMDGAKVCLRPSGTEPKAKAYIEVNTEPCPAGTPEAKWAEICKAADGRVQALATEFAKLAYGTIGQTPPAGADKLSR